MSSFLPRLEGKSLILSKCMSWGQSWVETVKWRRQCVIISHLTTDIPAFANRKMEFHVFWLQLLYTTCCTSKSPSPSLATSSTKCNFVDVLWVCFVTFNMKAHGHSPWPKPTGMHYTMPPLTLDFGLMHQGEMVQSSSGVRFDWRNSISSYMLKLCSVCLPLFQSKPQSLYKMMACL